MVEYVNCSSLGEDFYLHYGHVIFIQKCGVYAWQVIHWF